MGLRDALFGRTKQAQPKLDNLFALPTAALTLRSELDMTTSGQAGLCFKAGSGESSSTSDGDLKELLNFDEDQVRLTFSTDELGFRWIVIHDADIENLVTRIHGANTSLVEHGFGPRLLCAVFGFVPTEPPGEGAVRLVYLLKQGTFYPFAPTGPAQRDNELELRVRSYLESDLPMEKDLARWMALWNLPVS